MTTATLKKSLASANAFRCLECGKCTAACPISRNNGSYSPRRMVGRLIAGDPANVALDPAVWTCLSCGMCNERCPSDVKYSTMTRTLRAEAYRYHNMPCTTHGGALQATMRIMAGSDHPQDRMGWLTDELKVAETGEFGYFVGCLPYFDALFSDMETRTVEIARNTVKILNRLGVEPVVFRDERCCGHDLLWGGDVESFRKLAEKNVAMIRESGVKTVLTTCAECYRTLAVDYPEALGTLGFEIIYMTEWLAEHLPEFNGDLGEVPRTASYQDPCRLGRHMGVFDSPRKAIAAIPGLDFREMAKSGRRAVCCGTSAWQNCSAVSKKIQTERLTGARALGADLMITSCPKCYVHFKCALQGETIPEEEKIEVKDLMVVLGEALSSN